MDVLYNRELLRECLIYLLDCRYGERATARLRKCLVHGKSWHEMGYPRTRCTKAYNHLISIGKQDPVKAAKLLSLVDIRRKELQEAFQPLTEERRVAQEATIRYIRSYRKRSALVRRITAIRLGREPTEDDMIDVMAHYRVIWEKMYADAKLHRAPNQPWQTVTAETSERILRMLENELEDVRNAAPIKQLSDSALRRLEQKFNK